MRYPRKRRVALTLSRISYKMAKSLDWNFSLAEIDDACAAERYDLQCDLNCILLGKLPRYYLKKNGHLKSLSIDTVLESQFIDSHIVRTILSEINREWLKEKPLQLIGKTSFGMNFQDKPPKRVLSTDYSVEKCIKIFKNDVCECLIDFCQLLNSEDLYLYLTKNNCDIIVEKRFEKLRSELTKSIEKWCGTSKDVKQFRKRSRNDDVENHSITSEGNSVKNRKMDQFSDVQLNDRLNENLSNNVIDIEHELDEIIQAQLFDIDLGPYHKSSPDILKSENARRELAMYEKNDKTEKTYAEEQASIQQRLETEFDYFAKEIIKLNNEEIQMSKDSKNEKILTNCKSINIYEDIDADIIMANVSKKNDNDNFTEEISIDGVGDGKENIKFTRRDVFVNDLNILNKNVMNRSLRKKKLDLDDYDDYDDVIQAQKKHKKRKEDKKHKKRKRNKHKNGSSEKMKGKLTKSSRIKDKLDQIEAESGLPKSFTPNFRLYIDSPISYTLDPYQNNNGLNMNFDPEFDLLQAPNTGHGNPLMQMLLDNYFSGSESFLQGFIPDIKQFCIEMVNTKNAFLWALMLTNIDNSIMNVEENKMIEKQQSKTASNPLIQAFKQALEANKKKEETNRNSTPFNMRSRITPKHGVTKSKFNFKHPPGLSSLFKLQTNLKSTSRASIKEVMTEFQLKVFKLAKKENFMNNKENIANSTLTDIDYSVTPAHFSRVSKILSVLYDEAEWKITNKIKLINFDRKFFNNAFAIQNSLYNPMLADPNMLTSMYYQMQPMTDVYTTANNITDNVEVAAIATHPTSESNPEVAASSTDSTAVASSTISTTSTISANNASVATTKTSNTSNANKTSTSTTNSISASPMAYSNYPYNPYAAMQYANIGWSYMNPMGYYMPDLTTIQAYHQNMYNMSNTCAPTGDGSEYQMNNSSATATNFENDGTYNATVNGSSGQNNQNVCLDGENSKGVGGPVGGSKKDATIGISDVDRQGKNTRFYVFKNESEVSKEVEKFLDISGLKKFDIHNLMLLRHLPNFECLVFVHKNDGERVNEIPALLRLKRDLRVVFISYESLDDVMEKKYNVIFPRAGTVLMDENALVACKSEVLESVCQFMKKQTFEKGTSWKLLITSRTFSLLEKLKTDSSQSNSDEHSRYNDIIQILQKFQATNIVEELTDQYYMADPRTTADYQACFVALQRERYVSCRHFLFVTDMPRSNTDSRMFLTNGIDIMNIAEFMRCFVSKTIIHNPKVSEDHMTRTTPEKYIDAMISDCTQTITF